MNTSRISGIASGMDTETMIRDLMKVERAKADKLGQDKQISIWRQEQYNTVNKDFANFILDTKKELELTKTTSNGVMLNNSISNISWVKKGSSSDEDIFTVKTTATAMTGNHKVKVKRLAEGVNVVSTGAVKVGEDKATKATKLSELGLADGSITFEIAEKDKDGNFKTVKVEYEATDTIDKLIKKINNATTDDGDPKTSETSLGIQANFDETSGRLFLATKKTGEDAKIKITADANGVLTGAGNKFNITPSLGSNATSSSEIKVGENNATKDNTLAQLGVENGNHTLKLKIGGADGTEIQIDFDEGYTIGDNTSGLVKKINDVANAAGFGNNIASFTNGKLTLNAGDKEIIVTEDDQGLFTKDNKFKMPSLLGGKTGINAKIDFDGATDLEYNSNTIRINGIQINLKKLPTNTDETYTLKVEADVDGVCEKIKSFVEKYNELVGKMNTKVAEKRYRDYKPLNSEQKEAMKEEDVKLWEEKAKSGLLRNDEFLSGTMQTVRSGLYEKVDEVVGKYDQISTIGITTGKWREKGKLVIDERKLKDAIINDVDGVMNLLFKDHSSDEEIDEKVKAELGEEAYDKLTDKEKESYRDKQKRSESGIINRLYEDMVDGMKDIINKAGPGNDKELYRSVKDGMLIDFVTGGNGRPGSLSSIDVDVLDYDKKIRNEEKRLVSVEQRYWNKFTAMEKALSQMQSQSSWIAQQLGSM